MSILADSSAANPTLSALWSRARADYIGGCTAAEACRRYGLSRSRFFERAREEGWRRKDEPADTTAFADRYDPPESDDGAPIRDARSMADRAWRRADRALESGDLRAAQGWLKLSLLLRDTAVAESTVSTWRRLIAPPAPAPPPPKLTKEMIDGFETGDDLIRWAGEAMNWPELTAQAKPKPATATAVAAEPAAAVVEPSRAFKDAAPTADRRPVAVSDPPEGSTRLTADAWPGPDSPDYFDEPDSLPLEPEPEHDLPPLPPEEQAQWLHWAAVCELQRQDRPDEPWWGEAVAVDEERDTPSLSLVRVVREGDGRPPARATNDPRHSQSR